MKALFSAPKIKVKMKITILFLFFTAALLPASALGGCPKGREACPASAKKTSGFLKTVEAAQKAPSPAAAEQKAVPAKPPETPVSVADAAAAPKSPESAQGGPSKSAWLLLVGGGLAALYYYLKEGKRKGRKK
jgi:hypothetical protein